MITREGGRLPRLKKGDGIGECHVDPRRDGGSPASRVVEATTEGWPESPRDGNRRERWGERPQRDAPLRKSKPQRDV